MAERKQPEQVRVVSSGGSVRITQPKGNTKRSRSKAAVVVDVVTPDAVGGFVNFLREHAVVGLAVGLVIGTQLKSIVDSLNNGFISPLFGLFFGGTSLINRHAEVHFRGQTASLAWGGVVYQIIDFIFVMAVIYAIIKLFNLDKLDKPAGKS